MNLTLVPPSLCAACGLLALAAALPADQARLPVVADTSLQAYHEEINQNSGGLSAIRIKGIQHMMLLKLDLGAIAGWELESAELRLHAVRPHQLRTMGVSTIAADWEEGEGLGTEVPGGCTFTRAIWPDQTWAGPGSDFLDVALSAGHTRVACADVRPLPDGWFALDIPVWFIEALRSGLSSGLCITDEKGQTAANNDVHSREQNAFAPYVVVTGRPVPLPPPPPAPRIVAAAPWQRAATFDAGAARLSLQASGAHRLRVQTAPEPQGPFTDLARWLIPLPGAEPVAVVIPDLPPGAPLSVLISAVDAFGQEGPAVQTRVCASPALSLPAPLPAVATPQEPAGPVTAPGLSAWACPAECKVHPVSGNVLEEVGAGAYAGDPSGEFPRANPAWSGGQATLAGARGEVVALQVIVQSARPDQTPLQLAFGAPPGAPRPVIYRNWYLRDGDWFPEYLVPLPNSDALLPAPDNAVPGQRNQAFTLLWEIPRDAAPGIHLGQLAVASPFGELALPVALTVHDLELPARTTFEVSLNAYGPVCGGGEGGEDPWEGYLRRERLYFDAAHRLRSTLCPLGYSHSGNINRGWAPGVSGQGAELRITDWAEFDQHWGPYLDGSAFTGIRAGVPVSHLYLPFHENWPTPLAGHYTGGNTIREYPDNIIAHALEAPPVEQAIAPDLPLAFAAAASQFVDHFRDRGWTTTRMQAYLNDKYYYKDPAQGGRGTSWWLLDEPMHRDDWLALAYFARQFQAGVQGSRLSPADPAADAFIFRADISRPQWQRDWLDGLMDLMCVAGELFDHPRHCRRLREEFGAVLWHYAESNPIRDSNLAAVAWPLSAYCAGADGIVPWNSIGADSAFTEPTPTALLIPGARFGLDGPVVSLRALALCRGQQDVEYLNLLAARRGLTRDQTARLVADTLGLRAGQSGRYAEDAGVLRFSGAGLQDLHQLRESLAAALR